MMRIAPNYPANTHPKERECYNAPMHISTTMHIHKAFYTYMEACFIPGFELT